MHFNKVELENFIGDSIVTLVTLSGGDIAFAQKIETKYASYFIKSADFKFAKNLFESEALGLEALHRTNTIKVPQVFGVFKSGNSACLILEYIENKSATAKDMVAFGRALAFMHSTTKSFFGLEKDNFIGKLPQANSVEENWVTFYVQKRLEPQLKLAIDYKRLAKKEIPSQEKLISIFEKLVGNIKASPLHGDLWSGNFLISTNDRPYLIDPSFYYGHNEVDLAMSKLFGGFSNRFYKAYHEIVPKHENQAVLIDIYQLYYLLVHLNLFGKAYHSSVFRILKRYFL